MRCTRCHRGSPCGCSWCMIAATPTRCLSLMSHFVKCWAAAGPPFRKPYRCCKAPARFAGDGAVSASLTGLDWWIRAVNAMPACASAPLLCHTGGFNILFNFCIYYQSLMLLRMVSDRHDLSMTLLCAVRHKSALASGKRIVLDGPPPKVSCALGSRLPGLHLLEER